MKLHNKKLKSERKFECSDCGKRYKTLQLLYGHQNLHKGIFQCYICHRTGARKTQIDEHIDAVHNGIKNLFATNVVRLM